MSDDLHAKLSRRAYELWEQAGGGHGRHEEHWHQAGRELENSGEKAPASDVAATADEIAGLPRGEIPAADGTVMTEPATPVGPARKRSASEPKVPSKSRKPKAK